jgi:hypothetical protein
VGYINHEFIFFWIFDCEVGLTSIGQAKCAVDQNSLYTDLRILGKHFKLYHKTLFDFRVVYSYTMDFRVGHSYIVDFDLFSLFSISAV